MPSFDIVSRVELQNVDDAVNNARKEVSTRYDFRGATAEVTLDKKDKRIHLLAADEMKLKAMCEMLTTHAIRREIDPKALKFDEAEATSGGAVKCDVSIQEGLEREVAQKIVKIVKDAKLKVQAAIQGDEVRVSGKKIDDLQQIMQTLREQDLGVPLQFVNIQR